MNRLVDVTGGGTKSMSTSLQGSPAATTAQNLQEDTTVFLVDTTAGPTTLILPEGIGIINISLKFIIVDATGNAAANPITILRASASDNINGLASVVINSNSGSACVTGIGSTSPATSFGWTTVFGGGASSGGNSGTSWNKFQISGTTKVYNIATILGFSVTDVFPVTYDSAVLTPDEYDFDIETQNLTFNLAEVQDTLWIQFGYEN